MVQEICNSPGLRNTKMAPKKSPNYRNPRWLSPEKQEFNSIRKELWDTRKATFEKKFLTDPSVSVRKTPNTLIGKLKDFLSFSEHDFRNLSYDKDRLNSCYRIVNEMKGHLKKPYSAPGYLLYALHYSIACVRISSAVDFQPERIKLILAELQKEEREIYDTAKQIYENRHQQKVIV